MTSPSLPTLTGVSNFREMGGLAAAGGTIRHGALLRSAHLAEATDEDLAALAAIGVRTIVDFRTQVDIEGDGGADRVPDGAQHLALEMVDSSGQGATIRTTLMSGDQALINERYGNGKGHELAAAGVEVFALEAEKQAVFSAFLHTVLEADHRPILWHCSAGKDRAGWAATLLGIALGVSDEDLVQHYLLSNAARPIQERLDHYAERGLDAEPMRAFMLVHEDYIHRGLAAVDAGWSTRGDYLHDALGFGPDKVAQLRSALVT